MHAALSFPFSSLSPLFSSVSPSLFAYSSSRQFSQPSYSSTPRQSRESGRGLKCSKRLSPQRFWRSDLKALNKTSSPEVDPHTSGGQGGQEK